MIKAILFDNNGVLTTNDQENTYKVVAEFLKVSVDEVIKLFKPYVLDLDKGKLEQKDFYATILKNGNFKKSIDEFAEIHLNAYKPKIENQELAKNLKEYYKIALLTNFGNAFWEMFPKWGLDKVFNREEVFVSADIGLAKPDPAYFIYVLEKLNILAEETVFIDDNEENILAAKNMGINTILFRGDKNLVESLGKLGISGNI